MKQHLIRISKPFRFIIIFLLIIGGTIALVGYGQGYFYDFRTGEIVGGGLVVLDSDPDDARVWVDGEEKQATPRRFRLPVGQHKFEMFYEGYRDWEKTFDIEEGQVVAAEYPIFIPNEVETVPVNGLSDPTILESSHDQQHLAVVHGTAGGNVSLISAGSVDEPREWFELPSSLRDFRVMAMEWSQDNERLLLEASDGSEEAVFVLNVDSSSATRVDTQFDEPLGQIRFSESGDRLYSLDAGVLSLIDYGAGNRQTVAGGVVDWRDNDGSLYLLRQSRSDGLSIQLMDDDTIETLYEILRDGNYALELSDYDEEQTLFLHDRGRQQVTLLRHSGNEVNTETLAPLAAENISLSPNRRFLVMDNAHRIRVYDTEEQESHVFELAAPPQGDVNWFGNFHLLLVVEGNLVITEFDGANQEPLSTAQGIGPGGIRSDDLVFSVGQNAVTDRPHLQRSNLE